MITDLPSAAHRTPPHHHVLTPNRNIRRRQLRLGVLTPHNPYDQRAFSGTVFHAVKALSRQTSIDLHLIGPHRPTRRLDRFLRSGLPRFEPHMLAPDGSDFHDLDAVVGLVASALLDEAATLSDLPMIHVTDATPGFLSQAYGRDIPNAAIRREARVLARTQPVYSSHMMAEYAAREFGLPRARMQAWPFGVNFSDLEPGLGSKPPLGRTEVLFVGGDWDRKGGDLLLDAFAHLKRDGHPAHLTLVGGVPDDVRAALKDRSDITMAGFLDKNRPRHLARLRQLFDRAHVFALPTRADCTPMVIAEAMAHGTPVLATDVGAIGEMVGAGAGRVLPLSANAADWAHALHDITADPQAYGMYADAARERVETRLNWDSWATSIAGLATEMVDLTLQAAA